MNSEIAKIQIDTVYFPDRIKPALRDVNFVINEGDFIVITGSPASGKSVLLHCITGAVPKYYDSKLNGTVSIRGLPDNRSISDNSGIIGYMMQEPQSQIIHEDVYDDVAFGPGNLCLKKNEIDSRVHECLKLTGIDDLIHNNAKELSGGQAQRVVLAGVLALGPEFLLLDQPTAELDPIGRKDIYDVLGRLCRNKKLTICMVMDKSNEVLRYATRILEMNDGTIINELSPGEYLENLKKNKQQLKIKKTVKTDNFHRKTVAELKNVTYRYKNGNVGCESINFSIKDGEFIAVIGVNGSGKTTLAKIFDGLMLPTTGELMLFGTKVCKKSKVNMRKDIGFLFQNPDNQIFKDTLKDEIEFGLRVKGLSEDEISIKIDKALKKVGLFEYKDAHPQKLSRGQRQLLTVACILASDYSLIIADEPTSGLDEFQSSLIMDQLYNLNQAGKTILFISHDLSIVHRYAERIVVMHNHSIIFDISSNSLDEHTSELKEIGLDFEDIME